MSLPTIVKIVKNLSNEQIDAVKEIGFGRLLDLNCKHLDHEICDWLVRNFNPTECSLTVYERMMFITAFDVQKIVGIRSEGIVV